VQQVLGVVRHQQQMLDSKCAVDCNLTLKTFKTLNSQPALLKRSADTYDIAGFALNSNEHFRDVQQRQAQTPTVYKSFKLQAELFPLDSSTQCRKTAVTSVFVGSSQVSPPSKHLTARSQTTQRSCVPFTAKHTATAAAAVTSSSLACHERPACCCGSCGHECRPPGYGDAF
jgi:hypothetical protein